MSASEVKKSKKEKSHGSGSKEIKKDPLVLHKAIWKGDYEQIERLVTCSKKAEVINKLDHRGNAPLHIAAHFADRKAVQLLLDNGADPETLSKAGWRPIDEAIATGCKELAVLLMKAGLARYRKDMETNAPIWHAKLKEMPDFYMEMQWDLSFLGSWVPFVSNFIPNDTYKMWKKGSSLRLDYTLIGFKNFKIQRGQQSYVFTGEDHPTHPGHLFSIDHVNHTKQDFCELPGESYSKDIEDALSYLFAHDVCSHMPLGSDDDSMHHQVQFIPKTGWFSSKPVTEEIEGVSAQVFQTKGMQFRSLIRSDPHAKQTRIPRSLQPQELIEKHKSESMYERYFDPELEWEDGLVDVESEENAESNSSSSGSRHQHSSSSSSSSSHEEHKKPPNGLVWETEKVRRNIKKFEGKIWISDEYPLTLPQFATLLEVYSPTNQQWKRLKDFVSMNLPKGFPVKMEVPVFFLITAMIGFQNFEYTTPDAELFEIPEDYESIREAYIGADAREMFKTVRDNKATAHADEH